LRLLYTYRMNWQPDTPPEPGTFYPGALFATCLMAVVAVLGVVQLPVGWGLALFAFLWLALQAGVSALFYRWEQVQPLPGGFWYHLPSYGLLIFGLWGAYRLAEGWLSGDVSAAPVWLRWLAALGILTAGLAVYLLPIYLIGRIQRKPISDDSDP